MSRPLTGHVEKIGSRVRVSVPLDHDSKRRLVRYFDIGDDWDGWRVAALEAHRRKEPKPDADAYRRSAAGPVGAASDRPAPPSPTVPRTLGQVAHLWHEEHYELNEEGSPGRRDDVKSTIDQIIAPYFDARFANIEQILRRDYTEFARYLSGRDAAPLPRQQVSRQRQFTKAEAAVATGMSLSSIKRLFRDGRFPNAVRSTGRGPRGTVLIPATDLVAAGLRLDGRQPERRRAYAKSTATGILQIVQRIVEYALADGYVTVNRAATVKAFAPVASIAITKTSTKDWQPWTLAESAAVASHLSIHDQVVFWIQRLTGCRISEVFGLAVEDFSTFTNDAGVVLGTLDVTYLGGKTFKYRDEDGRERRTRRRKGGKTTSATRPVGVPTQLVELIELYIAAFHTDAVTGVVDQDARLVLPLKAGTDGGRGAYEDHLKAAMTAERFSFEDTGYRASTHYLRKCCSNDLQEHEMVSEVDRSRYLGHKPKATGGSSPVTMRYYTVHRVRNVVAEEVAARFTALISTELRSRLATPRPRRDLLGNMSGYPVSRLEHAEEVLSQAGLVLALGASAQSEHLRADDVAELLGISVVTVRKMIRDGALSATSSEATGRGPASYLIDPEIVQALLELRAQLSTVGEVAERLGIEGITVRDLVADGRLETMGGSREHPLIVNHSIDALGDELDLRTRVQRRSVTLAEAARLLGCRYSTARTYAGSGVLDIDPEWGTRRPMYVTRTSVDALYERRRPQRPKKPARHCPEADPEYISFEQATRETGLGHKELNRLSRKGVPVTRNAAYQYFIHAEALRQYVQSL